MAFARAPQYIECVCVCQCLLNFALTLNLIGLKGGSLGLCSQILRCLVRLCKSHGVLRSSAGDTKRKAAVGDVTVASLNPPTLVKKRNRH